MAAPARSVMDDSKLEASLVYVSEDENFEYKDCGSDNNKAKNKQNK